MRTTTVRFDADLWNDLDEELARLGLSRAEYVRVAVREKLVRDRYGNLEQRIATVERFLLRRFARPPVEGRSAQLAR